VVGSLASRAQFCDHRANKRINVVAKAHLIQVLHNHDVA